MSDFVFAAGAVVGLRCVILGVALLGASPPAVHGQDVRVPREGDVVRVDFETPGYGVRRIVGRFDGWDDDVIRFRGRLPFPRTNVQALWVSAGRVSALQEGAVIGLAGGVVVGTMLGLASRESTCGDTARCPLTVGFIFGVGFAATSVVLGALMEHEDWRPAALRDP